MYEAAMALRTRPKERRKVIFVISNGEVREPSKIYTLNKNIETLGQNEIQVFGSRQLGRCWKDHSAHYNLTRQPRAETSMAADPKAT
jgi:hypothetical protein